MIQTDTRLIPGHGSLASRADLENFHAMLTTTAGIVSKAMAAGRSLEEIKSQGLGAEWEPWGAGFINGDRWIETIYNSYSK